MTAVSEQPVYDRPLPADLDRLAKQIPEAFSAFRKTPENPDLSDEVNRCCLSYSRSLAWEAAMNGDAFRIGQVRSIVATIEDLEDVKTWVNDDGPFALAVAHARGTLAFIDRVWQVVGNPLPDGADIDGLGGGLRESFRALKKNPEDGETARAAYGLLDKSLALALHAADRRDQEQFNAVCDAHQEVYWIVLHDDKPGVLGNAAFQLAAARCTLHMGRKILERRICRERGADPGTPEGAALRALASVARPERHDALPLNAGEVLALMPKESRGDLNSETIWSFLKDLNAQGLLIDNKTLAPSEFYLAPAGYKICKQSRVSYGQRVKEVRAARLKAQHMVLEILDRAQPEQQPGLTRKLRKKFNPAPPLEPKNIRQIATRENQPELIVANLNRACMKLEERGLINDLGPDKLQEELLGRCLSAHEVFMMADTLYIITAKGRSHLKKMRTCSTPVSAPEAGMGPT